MYLMGFGFQWHTIQVEWNCTRLLEFIEGLPVPASARGGNHQEDTPSDSVIHCDLHATQNSVEYQGFLMVAPVDGLRYASGAPCNADQPAL